MRRCDDHAWLCAAWRATTAVGALRAARFHCNLLPQGPLEQTVTLWQNKLREANHNPADYRVGIIRPCFITDDPERDWPAVRQAERYRMQLYARFFAESGRGVPPDQDKQRILQNWVVGDVDHCVAELSTYIKEHGITDLVNWAVPPGMRPAQMQGSLERFATEVAPRLKAAVASC